MAAKSHLGEVVMSMTAIGGCVGGSAVMISNISMHVCVCVLYCMLHIAAKQVAINSQLLAKH